MPIDPAIRSDTDLEKPVSKVQNNDSFEEPTQTVDYSANIEIPQVIDIEDEPTNVTPRFSTSAAFSTVADFVSSDPDLQIYRRFDRLAARNLLHLQSELHHLEARLDKLDDEDAAVVPSFEDGPPYASLIEGAEHGDAPCIERLECMQALRSRLSEYQDALLKQSRVLSLSPPNNRQRRTFTTWFAAFNPFTGHDASLLARANADDGSRSDLVALRAPADEDRLTRLLENRFSHWLRNTPKAASRSHGSATLLARLGHRPSAPALEGKSAATGPRDLTSGQPGLFFFDESQLSTLVSAVSLLLGFFLLIGAIVALYFVKNPHTKLGLLALFTLIFACVVGLLTNAKRSEVFASTAAYTAVLVVFLGGDFTNG